MKTTSAIQPRGTVRGGKGAAVLSLFALVALAGCSGDSSADETTSGSPSSSTAEAFTTREVTDGTTTFTVVTNPGDGPVLSYGSESGVKLLSEEVDGKTVAFKDMNGNGTLDTWEDWRETAQDRAAALAEELSTEQIAGLMLFSSHERTPADGLTDAQQTYMSESRLRNVLNAGPNEVEVNTVWVNQMQAYAESLTTESEPYIPVNFSTDPRTTASSSASYNAEGADISRWPSNLGLAATFDVETVRTFASMTAAEYRALGIATALSPQIDLATEPRWLRVEGTFGEDVELTSEMAAALVDGLQSSPGTDGWGAESVNAMIKHWAGDGPGESGRESHKNSGKYGVYPGDNFDAHVEPFLGALDSAAIMTSYSIAVGADGQPLSGDRVGTAYDPERMSLLRDENGYDGVVVTDWGVTRDPNPASITTAWGAEDLTVDERHYAILKTGVDMFGGNNDVAPVLAARDMWQADFEAGVNEVDADTRFRQSGARILAMIFQPGLYESAYLDLDAARGIVASVDKVEAGYEAQLDSVVMLKNDGQTIAAADAESWKDKTVYIPRSNDSGFATSRTPAEYTEGPGLTVEVAEQFFDAVVTDEAVLDAEGRVTSYTAPDLADVDLVLVGMASPNNGNLSSSAGQDTETGEWYPLSLQYRPYTADGENVRQTSISGDLLPDGTQENRSYYGATSRIANESVLDAFERAVAAVEASGKDIPVVTVLKANNPTVPAEFEAASDAIVVGFGTSDQALIEVALGLHEPQGRLPIGFPASMDAVEKQLEDVGEDTEPYVDAAGNAYAFGFGLSYSGPITD